MHHRHVGIESKEGVGTVVTLQFPQKHRRVRMLAGGMKRTILDDSGLHVAAVET